MKRLAAACIFLGVAVGWSAAHASSGDETARRSARASGDMGYVKREAEMLARVFQRQSRSVGNRSLAALRSKAGTEARRKRTAAVHARFFTEKELEQIATFYESETGRKWVRLRGQVTRALDDVAADLNTDAMLGSLR